MRKGCTDEALAVLTFNASGEFSSGLELINMVPLLVITSHSSR